MRFRRVAAAAVVSGLVLLAGCGEPAATGGKGPEPGTVSGDITVFAASSLTESFTAIGKKFEKANPGATVTFNFGASSALTTQINEGAPADVFASAAPANMQTVVDEGNAAGDPVVFVRNELVIAVPKGNPKDVSGLDDLTKPGVKVALCAKQVPCGAAAQQALKAGGVSVTPATYERDVKAALSKVKLGEVDAALVYRTDVKAAKPDVDGVEFPESAKAINDYPIVALQDAPNRAGARAFLTYVRSATGEDVLAAAGFQSP